MLYVIVLNKFVTLLLQIRVDQVFRLALHTWISLQTLILYVSKFVSNVHFHMVGHPWYLLGDKKRFIPSIICPWPYQEPILFSLVQLSLICHIFHVCFTAIQNIFGITLLLYILITVDYLHKHANCQLNGGFGYFYLNQVQTILFVRGNSWAQ